MALVALVVTARADDEKKKKVEPSAPDSYKSLVTEWSKAQSEFRTEYRGAKTSEERQKLIQEKYPKPDKFAKRFLAFAEANADDPTAMDALVWIVTNDRTGKLAAKAIPAIIANHLDDPKIARVCQQLSRSSTPATKKLLQAVVDSSKNVDAQGWASYSLAKALVGRTGKRSEKAETLLARIVKDYKGVANGSLAKRAERDLFEIQHLSIGCEAPEITSEDIDGVEFSLADYRGKVVVLDFWGNW
jgi:hypothetical protein